MSYRNEAERESFDQIRVLHVDDEPSLADLSADFLERNHSRISVETETSADEGLERLSEIDFDCIVSDYEDADLVGAESA